MDNTPADNDTTTPTEFGEPREKTMSDGTEVKWCIICSAWFNHYLTGHLADAVTPFCNVVIESGNTNTLDKGNTEFGRDTLTEVDSAAVALIHKAGLLF